MPVPRKEWLPMFGTAPALRARRRTIAHGVGDGQLFIKPTPSGRVLAADAEEVPPYPGAKPHLLIDAERWEGQDWLSDLVRATAAELPTPKPKPAKAPKKTS